MINNNEEGVLRLSRTIICMNFKENVNLNVQGNFENSKGGTIYSLSKSLISFTVKSALWLTTMQNKEEQFILA